MRTGILGGTFDPVHNGHIAMADTAYNEMSLDEIILMPSGIPPHKDGISSAEDRLNMLILATEEYSYMRVSDYEINRAGTTYTADTLSLLSHNNPDNEYVFIVGADSLVDMPYWYRPDIIFGYAGIAVCARSDTDQKKLVETIKLLKQKFNANITILNFNYIDISSREIRACIASEKNVFNTTCLSYLNKKVAEYISTRRLYCID